jgi:hypothetical protein
LRSTIICRPSSKLKGEKFGAGGREAAGIVLFWMRHFAGLGFLALFAAGAAAAEFNDYPTSARADYVFGCMKANGETREALERCSCSIDIIASLIPYDAYVAGETFMSMGQLQGEGGVLFRTSEPSKKAIETLKRAQAEAEIVCF